MADSKITVSSGDFVGTWTLVVGAETHHFHKIVLADPTDSTKLHTIGASGLYCDVRALPALPAGSNNIGDVDVLSMPAVAQGTPAAGTAPWPVRLTDGAGNGFGAAVWGEDGRGKVGIEDDDSSGLLMDIRDTLRRLEMLLISQFGE